MEEYSNQFKHEEHSQTLTKALGGVALSFAALAVFQGISTKTLLSAEKGVLRLLRGTKGLKAGASALSAASKADTSASMWDLLKSKNVRKSEDWVGSLGRFVKKWDTKAKAGETVLEALKKDKASREAMHAAFKANSANKNYSLLRGMSYNYLKEFAYQAPMFYVGEQTIGLFHRDSQDYQKQKHPSWYNLPGHAIKFAKWAPGFAAFDIGSRVAFSSLKPLASYLKTKNTGALKDHAARDIIIQGMKSSAKYIEKGHAGYHRIKNAYRYAYRHSGAEAGHGIFAIKDMGIKSKYRINSSPVKSAMSRASLYRTHYQLNKKIYKVKFDAVTEHDKYLRTSLGSVDGSVFDKIFQGTDHNIRVGDPVKQDIYEIITTPKKLGWLPRILGLEHASLRNVKKADHSLYRRIYKKSMKDQKDWSKLYNSGSRAGAHEDAMGFVWGIKPGKNAASARESHLDLHYKQGVYYDPKTNELLDLSSIEPRALIQRAARVFGNAVSFGGKMDTAAVFQLQNLRYKAPNLAVSTDDQLINPRAMLDEYHHLGPHLKFSGAKPNKEGSLHGHAVYIRKPGKSGHRLYVMQDRGDGIREYTQITKDEIGLLPGHSHSKLRNILYQKYKKLEVPRQDPPAISKLSNSYTGRMRRWLYDKLNLFGGDQLNPSVLDHIHDSFGPTSLKRLFDKKRNPLLRKYGFDIKAYKKDNNIQELLDYLQLGGDALGSLGSKTTIRQRGEILAEFLKPKSSGKDADQDLLYSLKALRTTNIVSNPETARQAVERVIHLGKQDTLNKVPGYGRIKQTIEEMALSGNSDDLYMATGDRTADKFVRFIQDYRMMSMVDQGDIHELKLGSLSIQDGTLAERLHFTVKNLLGSTATQKDKALVDMMILNANFKGILGDSRNIKEAAENQFDKIEKLTNLLKSADAAGILSSFSNEIGYFTKYTASNSYMDQMFSTVKAGGSRDPFIPIHKNASSIAELTGLYVYDTFGHALDFMGMGWNRAKFQNFLPKKTDTGEWEPSVAALWGKRALMVGGAVAGYKALDTFFDINPMFNGTVLDEGLTVAAADQVANIRLFTAKMYDIAGITDAAKYMEGLMPKSTSILPGATVGFMMGGIPGAMAGAVVNRYTQPQLEGTPFSALAAVPVLAPFVADLTKSSEEIEDIYSGRTRVPYRKGSGWSLGVTPIEGGRVKAYVPNWYARLKSQYKASPVLYGSKLEQFIFQDLPGIDISIGDILNPRYLEEKHYKDRPYVSPDVPFSEVPIVGPILGATLGKAFNAIHPLGSNALMHVEEARKSMIGHIDDSQKSLWEYGGVYAGSPDLGVEGDAAFNVEIPKALGQYTHGEIASPYDPRQLLSEQIYRGFIEPAGLVGFATSAAAWGGNEPFINQPVFENAGAMDSFTRSYWDQNLGDMFILNEGFRRLFPRPRTDFEQVGLPRNDMPGWMPDKFKHGDPYCLTAESYVEVEGLLMRADEIQAGDLIRTVKGRFFPVKRVVPRPVTEDVFVIKLKGIPWPVRVTHEHPFYRERKWTKAENLKEGDSLMYPLVRTDLKAVVDFNPYPDAEKTGLVRIDHIKEITPQFARLTALLYKAVASVNTQHFTLSGPYEQEVKLLLKEVFGSTASIGRYKNKFLINYIHRLYSKGLPITFYGAPLQAIIQFLSPFKKITTNGDILFELPTQGLSYQLWNMMAQLGYVGAMEESQLVFSGRDSYELTLLMGIDVYSVPKNRFKDYYDVHRMNDGTHLDYIEMEVESVHIEHYEGLVYGFEVDCDDSFCVPGAVTHNTKVPYGDLLLPGAGYEASNDVDITFPTGPSSLGKDAYEQALAMIGLSQPFNERSDYILEEGTRIHRVVQEMLMRQNRRVRAEAMIYDPKENIKSNVDVLMPDFGAKHGYKPIEIKSIGNKQFQHLTSPKYEHRVQLNTYLNILDEPKGAFLYVNRDDPTQFKTFQFKYNPQLYSDTINRLHSAREMAQQFLDQGYGDAQAGYSYLDRAKVLINTSPYSTEFKDVLKIVEDQSEQGLLNSDQMVQFENLKREQQSMMWQQEMHPYRFQFSKMMSPDVQYQNYSLNQNIKAAAEYDPVSRLAGGVWEKFTHLKSPIHSKLFGLYSPEEQYERNVLYGRSFKGWNHPYSHWVEPYKRGLTSVTSPVQGAISWGTGGMALGGPLLASITAPVGALYGTLHGAYRAATGTKYMPEHVEEMDEMSEYFDRVKYQRAHQMYLATRDKKYVDQMEQTTIGWTLSGLADEGIRQNVRHEQNPQAQGYGTDSGFGSKWRGLSYLDVKGKTKTAVLIKNSRFFKSTNKIEANLKTAFKKALKKYVFKNSRLSTERTMRIKKVVKNDVIDNRPSFSKVQDQIKILNRSHEQLYLREVTEFVNHNEGAAAKAMRHVQNPNAQGFGSDMGFGSPWQGSDPDHALLVGQKLDPDHALLVGQKLDPDHALSTGPDIPKVEDMSTLNFGNAIRGLPAWDKSYVFPFINIIDADRQDKLLQTVDTQMADVLKLAWGRGSEIDRGHLDVASYFNNHHKPAFYEQIMNPAVDPSDVELKTIQNSGLDAHDFGLGWKQQMMRINNSPFDIKPISINGESAGPMLTHENPGDIEQMILDTLHNFGIMNIKIDIREQAEGDSPILLNALVSRDRSNAKIINMLS